MLPMVIKLTCLSAVLHRPLAGPSGLGKSLWSRKPAGRPGLAGPGLPCLGNRGGSCRSPRRRRRPTKGWALKPDQPGCGARSAVAPVDSRGRCFRCFRRSSQSKTTSPSKTATRLVGRGPVDRRGRGCRSRRERCQPCGEEGRPAPRLPGVPLAAPRRARGSPRGVESRSPIPKGRQQSQARLGVGRDSGRARRGARGMSWEPGKEEQGAFGLGRRRRSRRSSSSGRALWSAWSCCWGNTKRK